MLADDPPAVNGPSPRRRNPYVTALAWVVTAPFAAWTAVRVGGWGRFVLVPMLAFTPYVAIGSVVAAGAVVGLRRVGPAMVAAMAALTPVAAVVPRALPGPRPADPGGPTIRVLTANLYYGLADIEAVADLARREDIDVVALQEVTPEAAERLSAVGLFGLLPYRVLRPRPSASGSVRASVHPLDPLPPVQETTMEQPTARVRVDGGAPLDVVVAHPVPPASHDGVSRWQRELAVLPGATPDGSLRLIAGDFNATLDHAALRRLIGTGYVDAADAVGAVWYATWPADRTFPCVTIDHVLVDRRVRVERVKVHGVPGSDHRAVVAEITVPPTARP